MVRNSIILWGKGRGNVRFVGFYQQMIGDFSAIYRNVHAKEAINQAQKSQYIRN